MLRFVLSINKDHRNKTLNIESTCVSILSLENLRSHKIIYAQTITRLKIGSLILEYELLTTKLYCLGVVKNVF